MPTGGDDPMADAPLLAAWSTYRSRVSTPFTPTSPAGTVLASIDGARALLAARGEELLDRTVALVDGARRRLREVPGILVPGPEDFAPGRFDPTRIAYAANPSLATLQVVAA